MASKMEKCLKPFRKSYLRVLFTRRPNRAKKLDPPACITIEGLRNHFRRWAGEDELIDLFKSKNKKEPLFTRKLIKVGLPSSSKT